MKTSLICSLQKTGITDYIFDGEPEKNFPVIRKLGYDGVELAVRQPWAVDTGWLMALLEKSQLQVSNTGSAGVVGEGVFLTSPSSEDRRRCIDYLKEYVRFVSRVGGSLSIGVVRGEGDFIGVSRQQQYKWLSSGIRDVARYAEDELNVHILVEPLGKKYCSWIRTVLEALELINDADVPNLGLLVDSFHLYNEENDMFASIVSAGNLIKHFHISDSNRGYAGSGLIDFKKVIETLASIGYDGYLSLEANPLPDPFNCAKRNIDHLNNFLADINLNKDF